MSKNAIQILDELKLIINEYEIANKAFQEQLVKYGEENSRLKETIAIHQGMIENLQSPSVEETKLRADNDYFGEC